MFISISSYLSLLSYLLKTFLESDENYSIILLLFDKAFLGITFYYNYRNIFD